MIGKGGAVHQYFQQTIKYYAERQGYKVEIEKHLGGQKTIDLSLENGNENVAIEISISTEADDELENIKKCLSANYDRIVVLCSKQRTVYKLQKLVKQHFKEAERAKTFISPLNSLFRSLFRYS